MVLLVVVVTVSVGLGAVTALHRLTGSMPSCSPPTETEKQAQEVFLHSHVDDAADLEWTVADCDDNGDAWLQFGTALPPHAAREAFLTDSACSPYQGLDAGAEDVTCTSGDATIIVFLTPASSGTTQGELAL